MTDGARPPKVVVVMPAYNAARTLEQTWREVCAQSVVDLVIVVDDASQDATLEIARRPQPRRTRHGQCIRNLRHQPYTTT